MRAARLPLALALALPLGAALAARGEDAPAELDPGYGFRFLQSPTPVTNEKGLLEAIFQHRFVQPVNRAGGNNLGGLDSGANIGLGLSYVPVKDLAVEAYRGSAGADYEFSAKYTVLRATRRLPVAAGVRAGVDWLTKYEIDRRVGAFVQLPVALTVAERVTVAAVPTYVSNTPLFKDVWNVPLVLQVRMGKTLYATGEWVFRNRDLPGSVGQWSFALEKTVFRHRFSVWIGNGSATTVDQIMAADFGGGVTESNLRLGFNIIRQFEIATE